MPRDGTPKRRFTLVNLTVLVAATCAGVIMFRPYLASLNSPSSETNLHTFRTIETTYGAWSFVTACWMLALLQHPIPTAAPWTGAGSLVDRAMLHAASRRWPLLWGACRELAQVAFGPPDSGIPVSLISCGLPCPGRSGRASRGAWLLLCSQRAMAIRPRLD